MPAETQPIKCPRCRREVSGGAAVCPHCWYDLSPAVVETVKWINPLDDEYVAYAALAWKVERSEAWIRLDRAIRAEELSNPIPIDEFKEYLQAFAPVPPPGQIQPVQWRPELPAKGTPTMGYATRRILGTIGTLLLLFVFAVGMEFYDNTIKPMIASPPKTQKPPSEILAWAKGIARIYKQAAFARESDDCSQLREYTAKSRDIYGQIVSLDYPEEARTIHNKFRDGYSKRTDSDLFYEYYICLNDATYYEKYTIAYKESVALDEEAYHDFKLLMDKYGISCSDINFCASSYSPTKTSSTPVVNNSCIHWSRITSRMKNQSVCVYGTVRSVYSTNETWTRIAFTDTPNSFFLFSSLYTFSDDSGKLSSGDCVSVSGVVQLYEKIPYIDIGEQHLYHCEPWMEGQ